jgi:hypothetical protein
MLCKPPALGVITMHPPKLKKAAETPRFEVVCPVVSPLWKPVGISERPQDHDQALPHADQPVTSPLSHQMHAPGCESGDRPNTAEMLPEDAVGNGCGRLPKRVVNR